MKEIKNLIFSYCDKHLNDDYKKLSLLVFDDYDILIPNGMKRGNPKTWAASIIWAIGSVNFLSDKSFLPYASLNDVCTFFNTNTSTIGNKASQIKKKLAIDHFNNDYLLSNSPMSKIIDSMYLTDDA